MVIENLLFFQLHIAWHPPIGHGKAYNVMNCKHCNPKDDKLEQYADKIIINNIEKRNNDGAFSPSKMRGKPDVISKCAIDRNTWVPMRKDGSRVVIDVFFKRVVVPVRLKIWITYNANNSISNAELIHTDGSATTLGEFLKFFVYLVHR